MTKDELLRKLAECEANDDHENGHIDADEALVEYINDPEIAEAYNRVGKWYA